MGMPIRDDGVNEGENLTLACRNALLNMIDLLQERGCSGEQAYVLCSVAADLRISDVVDVPNYVVSALIPEAIFGGGTRELAVGSAPPPSEGERVTIRTGESTPRP